MEVEVGTGVGLGASAKYAGAAAGMDAAADAVPLVVKSEYAYNGDPDGPLERTKRRLASQTTSTIKAAPDVYNSVTTNECANTDKTTAADARRALVDFFSKFPELVSAPFFITGESYGGVYVPTLAKEVLDHTTINLHGVYVGDPCTDNVAQQDSMDMLW